jgi:hypothetical protein
MPDGPLCAISVVEKRGSAVKAVDSVYCFGLWASILGPNAAEVCISAAEQFVSGLEVESCRQTV